MATGETVNHKKFATHLLQQFSSESALRSVNSLMQIYASLPDSKSAQELPSIIDVSVMSTKTIRLVKLHLLDFITSSLKINLEIFGSDSHVELNRMMLHCTLRLINETQLKENAHPALAKYFQRCLLALYANLDAINNILALPVFLNVVEMLIKEEKDQIIKQRAIKILQERVQALTIKESQVEGLVKITNCLVTSLNGTKKSKMDSEIRQNVLSCLATLVEKVGSKSLDKFTIVFSAIIGNAGLKNANVEVCNAALLAMSSYITVLGPRIIPVLAQFMSVILEKLENAVDVNDHNSKLIIQGCLTAIDSLFEVVPMFMSAYLGRLILVLCSTAPVMIETESIAKMVSKLHTKIPAQVEHRVIFPAVLKQIDALVGLGSQSLVTGLSFLQEVIQVSKQSSLMEYVNDWSKLFLSLFDSQFDESLDLATLEQGIISLFIKFTLKMNEKAFKLLYLKCVEWGLNADDGSGDRKLFLFKLSDSLLQNLKSIFVPYFGFVYDIAVTVLEETKSGSETKPLWEPVLNSLGHCFAYDSNGN
jgi:U3 small nucleolar RNA-associated protein 10